MIANTMKSVRYVPTFFCFICLRLEEMKIVVEGCSETLVLYFVTWHQLILVTKGMFNDFWSNNFLLAHNVMFFKVLMRTYLRNKPESLYTSRCG
jgi:hypothetical protein